MGETKILELKNSVIPIKNAVDGCDSKLERISQRIGKLEGKSEENSQNEPQRAVRLKRRKADDTERTEGIKQYQQS